MAAPAMAKKAAKQARCMRVQAVSPGGPQGDVGVGEDDEIFVSGPFTAPPQVVDGKRSEEGQEDEASPDDQRAGREGEGVLVRLRHGGDLRGGDDAADGDDEDGGDDDDGKVDARGDRLLSTHAVVSAQPIVTQAVGSWRRLEF